MESDRYRERCKWILRTSRSFLNPLGVWRTSRDPNFRETKCLKKPEKIIDYFHLNVLIVYFYFFWFLFLNLGLAPCLLVLLITTINSYHYYFYYYYYYCCCCCCYYYYYYYYYYYSFSFSYSYSYSLLVYTPAPRVNTWKGLTFPRFSHSRTRILYKSL